MTLCYVKVGEVVKGYKALEESTLDFFNKFNVTILLNRSIDLMIFIFVHMGSLSKVRGFIS